VDADKEWGDLMNDAQILFLALLISLVVWTTIRWLAGVKQ
jgi:hypothetical protein